MATSAFEFGDGCIEERLEHTPALRDRVKSSREVLGMQRSMRAAGKWLKLRDIDVEEVRVRNVEVARRLGLIMRMTTVSQQVSLMRSAGVQVASRATKQLLKRTFPTVFFRHPMTALAPERLYAFLDAVWKQRDVEGSVVEMGCYLGGTAALASQMMEDLGIRKRYVAIDTFAGFVPEHFNRDAAGGVSEQRRHDFRADEQTVRRLLRSWGAPQIELVKADVATLDDSNLPDSVSLALVDLDLELPTYEGLRRVVPRLSAGGLVLVDDCNEGAEWTGAKRGYQRFVQECGLPERYHFGMGVVRRV